MSNLRRQSGFVFFAVIAAVVLLLVIALAAWYPSTPASPTKRRHDAVAPQDNLFFALLAFDSTYAQDLNQQGRAIYVHSARRRVLTWCCTSKRLDAKFGETIWRFIDAGKYEIRQASATDKRVFYRFQKPEDKSYPAMLELVCHAPDGITLAPDAHLAPLPVDEAIASLSAILLDNDYYEFVISGRREVDGLPWVGEDRLIPLKAVAWLDMRQRAARGEAIDAREIRKHANDVLRPSQLLAPELASRRPKRSSQI